MEKPEKASIGRKLVTAAENGDAKGAGQYMDSLTQQSGNLAEGIAPGILAAAKGGHLNVLQAFVKRGCRLMHNPLEGCCPLHAACLGGSVEVIKFVLDNGGKLCDMDERGWTSLHIVADQGLPEVIEELARLNVDIPVNAVTKKNGESALLLATKKGNVEMVRALLELNAATNLRDSCGATALYTAARDGRNKILKLLLEAKAVPDSPGVKNEVAIVAAARRGHAQVVRSLLDYDGRPHPKALWAAAQEGHANVIQELLCCGAVTEIGDQKGLTPLFLAAQNGHLKAVQELITGGALVDSMNLAGIAPLYIASKKGYSSVVGALLEAGADMNMTTKSMGLNPLHAAAQNGHSQVVEILLGKGANVAAKTTTGETPIFLAAISGHSEVVEILLNHEKDPEKLSYRGETLLHCAAKHGHKKVVNCLLDHGMDPETCKVSTGETPLFMACQGGHVEVSRILLDHGAKVDAPNKVKKTPLTAAAGGDHESVVKLLLIRGARTEDAVKALSMSKSDYHKKMLHLVSNYPCEKTTPLTNSPVSGKSPITDTNQIPLKPDSPATEPTGENQEGSTNTSGGDQCSTSSKVIIPDNKNPNDSPWPIQVSQNRCNPDMPLPTPTEGFKNLLKPPAMNGHQLRGRSRIPQQDDTFWRNGTWVSSKLGNKEGQQPIGEGVEQIRCKTSKPQRSVSDLKSMFE